MNCYIIKRFLIENWIHVPNKVFRCIINYLCTANEKSSAKLWNMVTNTETMKKVDLNMCPTWLSLGAMALLNFRMPQDNNLSSILWHNCPKQEL
jgi:hypothetical protein